MSKTAIHSMGELEDLARSIGQPVTYEHDQDTDIMLLAYRDNTSRITAVQYPTGYKAVNYHVDVGKVAFYISNLETIRNALSNRIQAELKTRVNEQRPTDGSEVFVGGVFELPDFSELSDIILLHKKIA